MCSTVFSFVAEGAIEMENTVLGQEGRSARFVLKLPSAFGLHMQSLAG